MSDFFTNDKINQEIKAVLEEVLQPAESTKYGYFIINKRNLNDICIINNHPEWFDNYLGNGHQLSDPVVKVSLSSIESFRWDEKVTHSSQVNSTSYIKEVGVMREAREYNIKNGQTSIIHDHKNNLALFSIYNHFPQGASQMPTLKIERQLFLFHKIHQRLLSFYQDVDNGKDLPLTKREYDILSWAAAGKTYKEISIIENITESTVKFHMAKVVDKLNATNAKHAISIACDLKIIKPTS